MTELLNLTRQHIMDHIPALRSDDDLLPVQGWLPRNQAHKVIDVSILDINKEVSTRRAPRQRLTGNVWSQLPTEAMTFQFGWYSPGQGLNYTQAIPTHSYTHTNLREQHILQWATLQ